MSLDTCQTSKQIHIRNKNGSQMGMAKNRHNEIHIDEGAFQKTNSKGEKSL